jgi:hypothetical protein
MFTTYEIGSLLQGLLKSDRFAPFEVVVADGRVLKIKNSEQAWIETDSSLLYVVSLQESERPLTEIVILSHIAMIRVRDELTPRTQNDCPF